MKEKMKLSAIARALVNDEFIFYYQPVISLFTGKICGVESLIRWKSPDGTIVPPGAFIPLAEETGFITEITQEMLPTVIRDLNALNEIDDSLSLSFNVSAKDIVDEDFIEILVQTTSGILRKPQNLCLEITETTFLENNAVTHEVLHRIADIGISLILDDFSAGYTTFATLTQLPLRGIKVALDITQRASLSQMDFRLFRHLVSTAHQLRLEIVAEGVETNETHSLMLATGCTHAQGFYYARPMPFSDLIDLLKKNPVWSEYPFGLEYLAQIDHVDFRRDIIRASLMIFRHPEQEIRDRALARLPELDPQHCLFGEWYTKIYPLNKNNKKYLMLGLAHEQLHEIANSMLQMALNDADWDEISSCIGEFSSTSKNIMDLIQDLENQQLKIYFSE